MKPKMAKQLRTSVSFILIITFIIIIITQVNSECCRDYIWVVHYCSKSVIKSSDSPIFSSTPIKLSSLATDPTSYGDCLKTLNICEDGLERPGFYCGVGKCSPSGCNCDGGCRRNTKGKYEEGVRLFVERTGLRVKYWGFQIGY